MDGGNWFVYCNDDPVNLSDRNGNDPSAPWYQRVLEMLTFTVALAFLATAAAMAVEAETPEAIKKAYDAAVLAVGLTTLALTYTKWDNKDFNFVVGAMGVLLPIILAQIGGAAAAKNEGGGLAEGAVWGLTTYCLSIDAFLLADMIGD